jgi:glutamyl-tRNA reductase
LSDSGFTLQRNHVAEFTRDRERRLVIIDIAVPRNVDPAVCELPGVALHNIDQLNEFVLRNAKQQHDLVVRAEKILRHESAGFFRQVASERVNPMVAEFRAHLGQVCSEEMERLSEEYGPFTEEQHEILNALAEHVVQRIASSLARTLASPPSVLEQETLANFLQGLFQVEAGVDTEALQAGQDHEQEDGSAPRTASGEPK